MLKSKEQPLTGKFLTQEPLAKYTTWRVGGPAQYFFQPNDIEDLANFLTTYQKTSRILWLGGGSNVLVPDQGIKATIIYQKNLNRLTVSDQIIRAESGVSCAKLVQFCLHHQMVACSFLAGIPGTIGGALAMNAGAYGEEIWRHVTAVETINSKGKIKLRKASEFTVKYREVEGLEKNEWFIAGHFHFALGNAEEAKQKIKEFWHKRRTSQPLGEFSCGSVFKNPPEKYAGQLIESCGLKGVKIGGAKISEKHANFIVNDNKASAEDIKNLIDFIVQKVENQHKIKLELEVKIWHE